jgi:pimeloyl-ACP methyl ester carboxylesterase
MPEFIYNFFLSRSGILLDGVCPSMVFSSLYEQTQLRQRDIEIRKFWGSGEANLKVFVLFGRNDPLLRDYKDLLVESIKTRKQKTKGLWLDGAGHYPTEERAEDIANMFNRFIQADD